MRTGGACATFWWIRGHWTEGRRWLALALDKVTQELMALAKERRPDGLELYTFQINERARRFYEHHGFVVAALGDGTGNEEGQPDVLYRWRP